MAEKPIDRQLHPYRFLCVIEIISFSFEQLPVERFANHCDIDIEKNQLVWYNVISFLAFGKEEIKTAAAYDKLRKLSIDKEIGKADLCRFFCEGSVK